MLFKDVPENTLFVNDADGKIYLKRYHYSSVTLTNTNSLLIGNGKLEKFCDDAKVSLYHPEDFVLKLKDLKVGDKFKFDHIKQYVYRIVENTNDNKLLLNETRNLVLSDYNNFVDFKVTKV